MTAPLPLRAPALYSLCSALIGCRACQSGWEFPGGGSHRPSAVPPLPPRWHRSDTGSGTGAGPPRGAQAGELGAVRGLLPLGRGVLPGAPGCLHRVQRRVPVVGVRGCVLVVSGWFRGCRFHRRGPELCCSPGGLRWVGPGAAGGSR